MADKTLAPLPQKVCVRFIYTHVLAESPRESVDGHHEGRRDVLSQSKAAVISGGAIGGEDDGLLSLEEIGKRLSEGHLRR